MRQKQSAFNLIEFFAACSNRDLQNIIDDGPDNRPPKMFDALTLGQVQNLAKHELQDRKKTRK